MQRRFLHCLAQICCALTCMIGFLWLIWLWTGVWREPQREERMCNITGWQKNVIYECEGIWQEWQNSQSCLNNIPAYTATVTCDAAVKNFYPLCGVVTCPCCIHNKCKTITAYKYHLGSSCPPLLSIPNQTSFWCEDYRCFLFPKVYEYWAHGFWLFVFLMCFAIGFIWMYKACKEYFGN